MYDDGGPDYNWSKAVGKYPTDLGLKWVEDIQNSTHDDKDLIIPDVDISIMNKFRSNKPDALFVALSRAKSGGKQTSEDPDFAWHPSVLVNEDRLCHSFIKETPTVKAREQEVRIIELMEKITQQEFHNLFDEKLFKSILASINKNNLYFEPEQ